MIPATNNKLLVAEDWKKIYQSFRNSDFQSYDFETLRRVMIQYLQENYPEDFNDFIDSSEYIALIDIIAYLGQNLSFRIDLNARENFIETASRRDSILRLAQLISYNTKRNIPANGLLKITSVLTTESVVDNSGTNLANTTITWSDTTNPNWLQQFISVLNSAIPGAFYFGRPFDRNVIDGVLTEQYRINSVNSDVPIYTFNKTIGGTSMTFEIVSSSFSGSSSIYEEPPLPGRTFGFIYKNDNQGTSSPNTGFFLHFRQGTLGTANFAIASPVPNEIVGVDTPDINNTDVWLWQLSSEGNLSNLWTKVSDIVGNNVIYNSLNKDIRNIYSVTSRDQDQIDLNFADGSFGNLPKGNFRLYYRRSNGLSYIIKPEQMTGISIDVPYLNKNGQRHTLTITMSLQYTVTNSSGPESNADIQRKAPQAYYIQNRMVTAEDYNVAPLTLGSDILKVKSVNRSVSGLSKYFDLNDATGKYSKTNIFADDGILYKEQKEYNFEFEFNNRNEIFSIFRQKIAPIVKSTSLRSFYFDNYDRPNLSEIGAVWVQVNKVAGQSRGYFKNAITNEAYNLGLFTTNNFRYLTPGALVKFVPPTGKYFLPSGTIVNNQTSKTLNYIWVKVIQVIGDGSNSGNGVLDDGTGPVIFSNYVDTNAIPVEIIPKFIDILPYTFESELVALCLNQRNFGITFNELTRTWSIISDSNLDLRSAFSLEFQGNIDNTGRDSSWIISFSWTGKNYNVRYRLLDYIFESERQTGFYVDPNTVNYDFTTGSVIKDRINVLGINTSPVPIQAVNTSTLGSLGKDFQWQIDGNVIEQDGYVDPKKVRISFYDYNNLGQITDPDTFNKIVEPAAVDPITGYKNKFVYFKLQSDGQRYQLIDSSTITAYPNPESVDVTPANGDLYYFYDANINVVKSYTTSTEFVTDPWIYQSDYFVFEGRDTIKFQYEHNSGEDRRIDPSKSNIMDIYLLTAGYDTDFRNYLLNESIDEPAPPTMQSLESNYSGLLEPIKTVSDELIFHSVKYKILFGTKADVNLQATLKAVRNPSRTISDNELKTRILSAINSFFALENWDFGQSFYFSELVTYVMNQLTPDITNFVIVPKSSNSFGSLLEIGCLSNEIFISGATVSDIEIIDAITSTQLKVSSIYTGVEN